MSLLVVRLGDEPRAGEEGAMSMLEGEEGVRADDDYAKGKICCNTLLGTIGYF